MKKVAHVKNSGFSEYLMQNLQIPTQSFRDLITSNFKTWVLNSFEKETKILK